MKATAGLQTEDEREHSGSAVWLRDGGQPGRSRREGSMWIRRSQAPEPRGEYSSLELKLLGGVHVGVAGYRSQISTHVSTWKETQEELHSKIWN